MAEYIGVEIAHKCAILIRARYASMKELSKETLYSDMHAKHLLEELGELGRELDEMRRLLAVHVVGNELLSSRETARSLGTHATTVRRWTATSRTKHPDAPDAS